MAIFPIYVRDRDYATKNIRTETVYLLEGDVCLNPSSFVPVFINGKHQTWSYASIFREQDGPIFEIRYKKAVIDPELNSMFVAAHIISEDKFKWGRIGKRYQFVGMNKREARTFVEQNLFNPVVQEIVDPSEKLVTLKPTGAPDILQFISPKRMSDEELLALSLKNSWNAPLAQLKTTQEYEEQRGKKFTDAELELIFGSWSDHCYHTTWKGLGLLQALKDATARINHPRVISAFHDNAGGIDFDGETVIILKGETHNHPFAIEPRGAVETKHGGVIRDVIGFGKGGYPIGGTTIVATTTKEANPKDCLDPERLVREAVKATASYCNPMGIPILHAQYKKHSGYAKPFALGHAIGIIPKKYALKDDPKPGDIALLIGGRTGRDGIHGATASSGEASSASQEKDFATVQIGDPITERKFMEAIPHLRDEGCIRSITDLGAMGIFGATGELAAKTGIRINLNEVPLKDTSLTAWEIGASESQERMLLAVPPKKLARAKEMLELYGVEYADIGKFTDNKKFEAFWNNEKVVDIDMEFLWGACPIEKLPTAKPKDVRGETPYIQHSPISLSDLKKRALEMLGSYNVSSKRAALTQFDKTVQGRTVIEPPYISVITPTRTQRGIVTTTSFNPQWTHLDPRKYVEMNFLEAVSRAVLAGADPRNIFICSNFYTPKPTPKINWHLKEMVHKLAQLTEEFRMPVVTGKDSSSGTYIKENGERIDVPTTFVPMALGILPDVEKVVTQDFKKIGSKIVLVGPISPMRPISPIHSFFAKLHSLYQQSDNPILSASVIGEGGLVRNLFEMCYGGGIGASLDMSRFGNIRAQDALFNDFTGYFLFELSDDARPEDIFADLSWRLIGRTQEAQNLFLYYNRDKDWLRWRVAELKDAYEKGFIHP